MNGTTKNEAASGWREPMVWLVWSGPALVVVASIVTAVIAVRMGDRPLAEEPPAVRHGQAGTMTPAMVARNHTQTMEGSATQAAQGAAQGAVPEPAGN
jgi:hypothetical protein